MQIYTLERLWRSLKRSREASVAKREIVLNLTNRSTHLRVQAERWSTMPIQQIEKVDSLQLQYPQMASRRV